MADDKGAQRGDAESSSAPETANERVVRIKVDSTGTTAGLRNPNGLRSLVDGAGPSLVGQSMADVARSIGLSQADSKITSGLVAGARSVIDRQVTGLTGQVNLPKVKIPVMPDLGEALAEQERQKRRREAEQAAREAEALELDRRAVNEAQEANRIAREALAVGQQSRRWAAWAVWIAVGSLVVTLASVVITLIALLVS